MWGRDIRHSRTDSRQHTPLTPGTPLIANLKHNTLSTLIDKKCTISIFDKILDNSLGTQH